ncbi:hypothetical protein GCM10023160_30050 [Brachybacterium paraconglomeratum]|uniref:hypothetical protein n=1 Tax=Brachybacterium paraconglomeratum TaxID=173362 RepID=UPI0031F0DE6B
MSKEPGGEQRSADSSLPDSSLPDFSSQSSDGLPAFDADDGPVTLGAPSERALRRSRTTMLAVIGSAVVVLAVLALVLSQTVFRSALDDPDPTAYQTGERSAEGQSEYVPDPQDPDIAPPPPLFTQAPTTECTVPTNSNPPPSVPGKVRGGGLEYTNPEGWGDGWSVSSLPYLTEVGADSRLVEGGWYSVLNLGRVAFPENEGGYPGLEPAAVAIFQCYATTSGVLSHFGEHPEVTDYRSEVMSVDGTAAWIVQATYHFEDPSKLESSSASVVTSIVVETPNGPSALVGDVAADQPEHAQNLEDILASLAVVE